MAMRMIVSIALNLLFAGAVTATAAAAVGTSSSMIDKTVPLRDIRVGSSLGKKVMSNARALEQNKDMNYDFIADYSIKFQGCHHVSQWNPYADDEDDVRIKTKRLVRFRLCPVDSCSNSRSSGCSSKYGDYVVDLNTFVASYLEAVNEDKEEICYETQTECQQECNSGEDQDCMDACYEGYDVSYCNQNDDQQQNDDEFDAYDYSGCAQIKFERRRLEENDNDYQYYIGPYCADQGGEIHLGLFTEETCTTFANNGETMFYNAMGYELPYSDSSLVSSRCMACANNDGNDNYELKDVCNNVYQVAGKCETKMSVEYPNESACTYIEGIKIIREDGVIRTSAVKKSKAAAVCIGLFLTIAVLLAGYVYYLRTKLGRAQINLSAASQATLT